MQIWKQIIEHYYCLFSEAAIEEPIATTEEDKKSDGTVYLVANVFLFCNPGETSHVKAFSTLLSILIFLKHSETIWNIGKINTNANEKLECWFKGELHCNLGTVSWNFKWTKLFVHLTVQLKMWEKKSYLALSLNYVTILDIHDSYMYTKEKKSMDESGLWWLRQ